MTIDKGNIEAYLLDYLEGNLNPVMTAELMAFLSENPEYEQWIPSPEDVDGTCLPQSDKGNLKKGFSDIAGITDGNLDEFCIAQAEGLLSDADEKRLGHYLENHPEKQPLPALYKKLRLTADLSVIFPGKEKLKKSVARTIRPAFIITAIGIAAAVALFLLLYKPARQMVPVVSQHKQIHEMPAKKSVQPSPEHALTVVTHVRKHQVRKIETDTSETIPVQEKNTELAVIEPVLHSDLPPAPVQEPLAMAKKADKKPEVRLAPSPEPEPAPSPAGLIAFMAKKINLWKAAETAVSGFNHLTESRLAISKTVDENGKVTSFGLITEENPLPPVKTK